MHHVTSRTFRFGNSRPLRNRSPSRNRPPRPRTFRFGSCRCRSHDPIRTNHRARSRTCRCGTTHRRSRCPSRSSSRVRSRICHCDRKPRGRNPSRCRSWRHRAGRWRAARDLPSRARGRRAEARERTQEMSVASSVGILTARRDVGRRRMRQVARWRRTRPSRSFNRS